MIIIMADHGGGAAAGRASASSRSTPSCSAVSGARSVRAGPDHRRQQHGGAGLQRSAVGRRDAGRLAGQASPGQRVYLSAGRNDARQILAPGRTSACPPADAPDELRFSSADLTVSHAILLNGRRIGTLVLLYDLGEISERIRLYGATVLGVLLVSSLIAFLLSSRLRALIATPISQLVRATTSVSETGDYSIRARKTLRRRTRRAGGPIQRDAGRHPVARQQSHERASRSGRGAARCRESAGTVSLHGRIDAAEDFHRHARRRGGLPQPAMDGVHRPVL